MQIMQPDRMLLEYILDTLQDNYDQLEDRYFALRGQFKEKNKCCELLRKDHERVKREFAFLRGAVQQKSRLVQQNGLRLTGVAVPVLACNRALASTNVGTAQPVSNIVSNNGTLNKFVNGDAYSVDTLSNGLKTDSSMPNKKGRPIYPPPPPPSSSSSVSSLNGHGGDSGFASMNGSTNGSHEYQPLSQRNGCHPRPPAPLPDNIENAFVNWQSHPAYTDTLTSAVSVVNGHSDSSRNGLENGRINGTKVFHSVSGRTSSASSSSSSNKLMDHQSSPHALLFSREMSGFLQRVDGATLNEKIRNLLHDKAEKRHKLKNLRSSLDDEKIRSIKLEGLSLLNHKHNGHSDRLRNRSQCEYNAANSGDFRISSACGVFAVFPPTFPCIVLVFAL